MFLIAFGVTDEVFSVLSFQKGNLSKSFILIVQLAAYSAWVGGSVAGYVLGGFLPEILTKSMGIALYSLLLAIIIPEVKKSFKILLLVMASGFLNTILIKLDFLPDGWTIIVCIFVIAFAGSFLIKSPTIKREIMNNNIFLLILGMAAVTYIPRLLPFLVLSNQQIPERLNAFLKCIPAAAIGALIIPVL